ncbi:MAG: DUF433 domain-containing protein [Candidatus Margulisbacteria bacterium]|nr:DUF433 domain-containing protein [Candidatus Margulisiibacteriota bacterium]
MNTKLGILGGKPIIKGTRITVPFILNLIRHGMTVDQIIDEYPRLEKEDIFAALGYAEGILEKEDILFFQNK